MCAIFLSHFVFAVFWRTLVAFGFVFHHDWFCRLYIDTIEYDYPTFHLSMKCFACTIAGGSPHLLEHEAAKWLTSTQLCSVNWLPADVTLIPKIEKMMEG